MEKILPILKYVLLAISALSIATLAFLPEGKAVGLMLNWMYCLGALTVGVTLLLPLMNIAQDPKGAVKSLGGFAIVVAIVAICYALSDGTPLAVSGGIVIDNELELRMSDTGLYAAYFALGMAILATVVGELWNSIK